MNNLPEKFTKPYDAANTEDRIYDMWEKSGYFNPDVCIEKGVCAADADHFSIVLPPPNVTGKLHLGHSLEDSLQDTIIRFERMRGKRTLWIPGTDHAAIATQAKFEKELYKKEKKSRHDFSREEFFDLIQEFAVTNQNTILSQLRKMGASLDWSRLAFTLDEERQEAVFTAFERMYEAGLIYQKDRIVNWDVKGQTTVSDDEVERQDRKSTMYTFKYSSDFPFPIATTRPETKLGDTAVAVHPEDKRYQEYVGKEFSFDFAGEPVTVRVIADSAVDPEFGVGALGVTPAHSITDWEIAERHNIPLKQVINEYGKMMVGQEGVFGTKAAIAREAVVAWLRSEGLMIAEEEIDQSVGIAERTGGIIEPLPKLQWWISVSKEFPYPHDNLEGITKGELVSLKKLMLHVVKNNQVTIVPERFEKTYLHWIENLRDWNISRQINYGHRVPVWYKDDKAVVSRNSPGEDWTQDEDTLDTWFSSGLWSFSTLGWPNKNNELAAYHPTNLLNPGYEILPLWVSRMILFSVFLLGEIPFHTAAIHGLLRAKDGRKFSKSLNNGVEALEIIEKYGTDALRMALIVGVAPGQDVVFDEQKVKAYRKFANKLWNIARFVLENTADYDHAAHSSESIGKFIPIATELAALASEITSEMEELKYYLVSEKLYHYVWDRFASEILEELKPIIQDESHPDRSAAQAILWELLTTSLTLLHPFMPFVTEEIWQSLPVRPGREQLMITSWPVKQ